MLASSAGYPITPASEITEGMSVRLPLVGGVFLQMEDEIASMGAAIGASMAGAKCLTSTAGPGFSLKQEGIGIASMMEIPVVIVDVMRWWSRLWYVYPALSDGCHAGSLGSPRAITPLSF